MSLRWRLLRFLRASEADLAQTTPSAAPLLPTRLASGESYPVDGTVRLAAAALRATHAHGFPGLRALAQPRGAVEVLAEPPRQQRSVLPAHDRVAVSVAVAGTAVVTLGIDDNAPTLKFWTFGDGVNLQCRSILRFTSADVPTAMVARTHSDDRPFAVETVAVGFADGAVMLLRGEFLRERITRQRVAPAPGEMGEPRPVVALAFEDETLFVVTEASVSIIDAQGRRSVLDTRGAQRMALCAFLPLSRQLCVAREEALYFFNRDGRGPCLAFPTKCADGFVSALGKYVLHGAGSGEVVAYDVANKVLAYRGKGDVRCAFPDGHAAALLCMKDGGVRRLKEISLAERVAMLLDRGLYVVAVSLARTEGSEAEEKDGGKLLTHALKQYAEHLISKDEFHAAAAQLVETIGAGVEPSWVITRLVEQPGLRSGLRLYLEALHEAGRAAFVHTKVLVTCYRHDRARAAVLPTSSPSAAATTDDDHLISVLTDVAWCEREVDTAIELCREAGLFRVAKSVAQKRGRYLALANTLVEDMDDLPGVISLLNATVDDSQVLEVLRVSARKLLVRAPGPFVEFLSNAICKSTARAPRGEQPVIRLSEFSSLFADRPRWNAVFLERILARPGGLPSSEVPDAWLALFEALVCVDVAQRVAADPGYSHDLGETGMSDVEDRRSTVSALTEHTVRSRPRLGRRALKILQSRRSLIDLRRAVRICELHGHDTCLEYLYEYLRMYRELGVCLRLTGNGAALLRAARRHGEREPQLWLEALRVFAPRACEEELALNRGDAGDAAPVSDESSDAPSRSSTRTERAASEVLNEILAALDRSAALSAVEILDVVTDTCPQAPWTMLEEYFEQSIGAQSKRAMQEEHTGFRLDLDLQELRKDATRLGEEAVVVKPHSCNACEDGISVPMIHFFCGHSFHASCLAPSSMSPLRASGSSGIPNFGGAAGMWIEECPKCAPEQDATVSMRQAIEEKNLKHDEFFGQLSASRDGFTTVVEYLERSPFI